MMMLLAAAAGGLAANLIWTAFDEAVRKPWLVRKTRQLAPGLVAAALEHADRIFPRLVADGLTRADLEVAIQVHMEKVTGQPWKTEQTAEVLDLWDPRVFLEQRRQRLEQQQQEVSS